MTKHTNTDHGSESKAATASSPSSRSTEAKRTEGPIEDTKKLSADDQIDELRAKAISTARTLYRDGRDFLANNEEVSQATAELSEAIRRNPLTAVGIAFTAGLVLALLTRG